MTQTERELLEEQTRRDAKATREDEPMAYRRIKAAYGQDKANDILGIEGLPITGMGNDQFKENRDRLGYTHEEISRRLSRQEQTRILADDEPLEFGGTM